MKKYKDYINESYDDDYDEEIDETQIVNDKLKELNIDVSFERIGGAWSGDKSRDSKDINLGKESFGQLGPIYDKGLLSIHPTYDPKYHSTYNPNPSISIKINYYMWIGKHRESYQIYCNYPIETKTWTRELRGGKTGKDIYT